jgi:hypothetical protein
MRSMDIKPTFEVIDRSKPVIQSMEVTEKNVLDTGVTYNEAGYTYNTLGTAYGGIYGSDGKGPVFDGR